jgi:hypothetical protein
MDWPVEKYKNQSARLKILEGNLHIQILLLSHACEGGSNIEPVISISTGDFHPNESIASGESVNICPINR